MNLRTHFEEANRLFREIDDSPLSSTDAALLRQVADALRHARACEKLIAELSVFSSNETVRDINPSDLKFLLVPYLIAELTMRQVDNSARIEHLRSARFYIETFLETLARIELITEAEAAELSRTEGGGPGLGSMAMKREQRIARIKAERVARAQMEAAEAKLAIARGRSGVDADDRDDSVDDLEREHATQWLHVAKFGAADSLQSLVTELQMLEEVEKRRRDDPNFARALEAGGSEPPRPERAEGSGLQSFHIPHSSRQEAYDRVRARALRGCSLPMPALPASLARP
jgi:immunoglobulin-binding protein 1